MQKKETERKKGKGHAAKNKPEREEGGRAKREKIRMRRSVGPVRRVKRVVLSEASEAHTRRGKRGEEAKQLTDERKEKTNDVENECRN